MPKPAWGTFILETLKTILIVTLLAVLIRTFLIQPFIVEGHSMEANYHNGDYLLIDKLTYRFHAPARGQVIVFVPPQNSSEDYIKRIIGLPGDRVVIEAGQITVYNSAHPNGKVLDESYLDNDVKNGFARLNQFVDITLKSDEYYVMGDNRTASTDSRVFGPIKKDTIVGRSLIRLFPFSDVTYFGHALNPIGTE